MFSSVASSTAFQLEIGGRFNPGRGGIRLPYIILSGLLVVLSSICIPPAIAAETPSATVNDSDHGNPMSNEAGAQEIAAEQTPEESVTEPEIPYGWTPEYAGLFTELSLSLERTVFEQKSARVTSESLWEAAEGNAISPRCCVKDSVESTATRLASNNSRCTKTKSSSFCTSTCGL